MNTGLWNMDSGFAASPRPGMTEACGGTDHPPHLSSFRTRAKARDPESRHKHRICSWIPGSPAHSAPKTRVNALVVRRPLPMGEVKSGRCTADSVSDSFVPRTEFLALGKDLKAHNADDATLQEFLADDRTLIRDAGTVRFLLLKPDDVPTYVEFGAADIHETAQGDGDAQDPAPEEHAARPPLHPLETLGRRRPAAAHHRWTPRLRRSIAPAR